LFQATTEVEAPPTQFLTFGDGPPNPEIMQGLAGAMVLVAIAYIFWYFYDYWHNGAN